MLFFATSINYIDRQTIAILKPTLEHSIGMTEIDYGYIVDAFQIAYAIGLLGVGRVIDRVGTRIGYMLVMAFWSLSAMGHALASTAMEFGVARFFLGLGESGNFPAAIKTVAEWFPQKERSLATGIFNSGANVGAIVAPLIVPCVTLRYGWHVAFLTTGIFSALWICGGTCDFGSPRDHPRIEQRRASPYLSGGRGGDGAGDALASIVGTVGRRGDFRLRKVSHRSDLVFLPVLAAVVLQRQVPSESLASWAATDHHL